MADNYWDWYQSAFGAQPAQQGPAPGPAPLSPQEWDSFYRSVGIAPQGPTTRTVQSVPVNLPPLPRSTPERATTIAELSTKQQTTGNSYAGQERYSGPPAVPAYIPERLASGGAGIPANFGTMTPQQVARIGVGLGNEVNAQGKRTTVPNPLQIVVQGANPIRTAQAKVAPIPFPPYRAVGSQLDAMPPLPLARPNRPQVGLPMAASIARGVRRAAPTPMTRPAGLPIGAMPAGTAPLRITVAGASPIAAPNPIQNAEWAVKQSGDTSSGNRLEMASLIASGNSWREAQERKK